MRVSFRVNDDPVAQAIGEVEARLDVDRDGIIVDPETHPHHALPC